LSSWSDLFPEEVAKLEVVSPWSELLSANVLEILDSLDEKKLRESFGFCLETADAIMKRVSQVVDRKRMHCEFHDIVYFLCLDSPSSYHKQLLEPIVASVWKWLNSEKLKYVLFIILILEGLILQ
jgi:hypothetical protein